MTRAAVAGDARDGSAPARALKIVGSVLAPTTVLAALLFYFGTQHVNGFCSWFGVHYAVLGLSVSDYLIRAADGMFGPLTFAAAIGLGAVWGYRLLEARLSPTAWRNLTRRSVPVMVVSGLGLVALGITGLAVPSLLYPLPGLPGSQPPDSDPDPDSDSPEPPSTTPEPSEGGGILGGLLGGGR